MGRKGVGTFSGIRYFRLSSVGHCLQRAPVEDSTNAGNAPIFKHGVLGVDRGIVFGLQDVVEPYSAGCSGDSLADD